MTLYDAMKLYLVYLQGLHLNKTQLSTYQRVLRDVLSFYGGKTPLTAFDDTTVLDYIRINDPFDCDPVHQERGDIYSVFTHWLMQNKLIPAWADQPADINEGRWVDEYETF